MARTIPMEARPYVSNYPPLERWLNHHQAKCMTQMPIRYAGRTVEFVEFWLIKTQLVVVTVKEKKQGWQIYMPAQAPGVRGTFDEVEAHLQLGHSEIEP